MGNLKRRGVLMGGGAALGAAAMGKWGDNLPVMEGTRPFPATPEGTILNDASELNPTTIFKHVTSNSGRSAQHQEIRDHIVDARQNNRPFNIGAARHSMGGQAIPKNGTALTLDNSEIEIDKDSMTYRVHAGARWSQVIAALDAQGFSPKVMQSNNDFGVAATFSVNAHGWAAPLGPMGATVREIELVLPNLDIITASRTENPDIFAMAMGGYGLVGAITSLVVEMVPNQRLDPTFEKMPATDFAAGFTSTLNDPSVNMAYGRLNVQRGSFFEEALLISYRASDDQSDLPPASSSGMMSHLASRLYRTQLGNEPMKAFRWWVEAGLGPRISGEATRNSLINEPVVTLDDRNPDRVDILHEYFVSPDRFNEFLDICQRIIPASYQEFLNVTLRYVDHDPVSVLSYAWKPRIAAVMSFSQELTQRAEADMQRMTQALVEAVIGIDGAYYLPYRQHPTLDQFNRCYARSGDFAAQKRALDPNLVLRNNLWDQYLGGL